MRVIVEYKDGSYTSSDCISLKNIEKRTKENKEIDEMLCDRDFKHMFVISDDAHLGGFTKYRYLKPNICRVKSNGELDVYT